MPESVAEAIGREIDRLERTSEQSPENGWIRAWLDTVFELPWGNRTDDRLDLEPAREVLDADHTGLEDVKERIIEHLAVRKLRRDRGLDKAPTEGDAPRSGAGAILLLVGPPGVGKTSLGESVARALVGTLSGWPSAACEMRQRCEDTDAPMWERAPGVSPVHSWRQEA